ncbi:MAG TPA: rRNA adenine N-6-methyltransferase family protein [Chitinophagales bacterium]|nr:rRNA adenine N-6-methyltransferase family protein [Chitinophagales bacterium]
MEQSFIKIFLKDKNVGALFPTSQAVIKRICSKIDFNQLDTLVEYGPGNGVITVELLKRMKPTARLFAIETNEDFLHELHGIHDQRLHVIGGSAADTMALLKPYGVTSADCVLSGIPFTFLKPALRNEIIFQTKELIRPGGKCLLYQHSPLMKKYLKTHFGNAKVSFELRSIPTMFVLESVK